MAQAPTACDCRDVGISASQGEIVVGLDIGTTKICAVVAEVERGDEITILGVGVVPCRGLRKGIVANIDWTVRSIRDAIDSAQTMAGVEIRTIYAGISGSHVRSSASDGVAATRRANYWPRKGGNFPWRNPLKRPEMRSESRRVGPRAMGWAAAQARE